MFSECVDRRILLSICFLLIFVMIFSKTLFLDFDTTAIQPKKLNYNNIKKYPDYRRCLIQVIYCFVLLINFCLIQIIENRTELWSEFVDFVSTCSRNYLREFKLRKFQNRDETKYAIIPDNFEAKSKCNIVTLGIGNDILVEKQMNKRMPWCRFYGADPVNYRVCCVYF
jgi:hypothetical protein